MILAVAAKKRRKQQSHHERDLTVEFEREKKAREIDVFFSVS